MRIMYLVDRPAEDVQMVAGWFVERWGLEEVEAWLPLIGGLLTPGALPTTFVAVDDGRVVGTASLVASGAHAPAEHAPWLTAVFVPPGERGRGVCAALIRRARVEASALGFAKLYFETQEPSDPYERLGWSWVGADTRGSRPTNVLALDLSPVERSA